MSFDDRSAGPLPARTAAMVAAVLFVASAFPSDAETQTVTDRLATLAEENAILYLHPVSAGLGAGLNSGFFESAGGSDGIHVRAGLQVSGSLIPEDVGAFEPVLPRSVTYRDRTFQDPYVIQGDRATTPTAVGEGDGVVLEPSAELEQEIRDAGEDPADFEIALPGGVDLPAIPLAMGEASVQLPTGSGVMVRFLPEIDLSDDVGPVSVYGFGVRQSVTAFVENPPVNVAVAAGYQKLSLGDVADATGRSADLIVSKDLDVITVFASGGVEGSSVDVEYTFDNPTNIPGQPGDGETIAFEDDGENTSRFTGGVHVNVFVARLSVSYTKSAYDVLQARLSFGG